MAELITVGVYIVQGFANMCMNSCRRCRNHCTHCDGTQGPCSCTFGCVTKRHNNCQPFHEHVSCNSCGLVGMLGDRFKCRHCNDFDLCSGCYNGGAHDSDHSFMKLERAGMPPTFVSPRSGAPMPQNVIMESANQPSHQISNDETSEFTGAGHESDQGFPMEHLSKAMEILMEQASQPNSQVVEQQEAETIQEDTNQFDSSL